MDRKDSVRYLSGYIRQSRSSSARGLREVSKGKQLFAYVAHVTIPLKNQDDVTTHHIVIARKKKAGPILFITSYSIDQNEDFLRAIEKFRPYLGE